jgi:hypothetical protein
LPVDAWLIEPGGLTVGELVYTVPASRRAHAVEWALITLRIYRKVFSRAGVLALKNWPVLGTLFVYWVIMAVSRPVAVRLGILGGFLLSLVRAACIGSFLYLVEMMVRTAKVTIDDFRRSFGVYLWDVVGIMFVYWMFSTLAVPVIAQFPQGLLILLCVDLAVFVVFNAVPELIYMGHYSSLAVLSESYGFIATNWIEWFPANLAAAAVILAIDSVELDGIAVYVQWAVLALVIYFTMVMRGLLFIELHGSTHRSRVFKYRMEG